MHTFHISTSCGRVVVIIWHFSLWAHAVVPVISTQGQLGSWGGQGCGHLSQQKWRRSSKNIHRFPHLLRCSYFLTDSFAHYGDEEAATPMPLQVFSCCPFALTDRSTHEAGRIQKPLCCWRSATGRSDACGSQRAVHSWMQTGRFR